MASYTAATSSANIYKRHFDEEVLPASRFLSRARAAVDVNMGCFRRELETQSLARGAKKKTKRSSKCISLKVLAEKSFLQSSFKSF